MAYDITLEGKNKEIAERMLENAAKIFDECNIEYWLEGGTLLGIRRENRLLPWDDDIDVSMMVSQQSKLKQLYAALKKANYRVKTRYFEKEDTPFKKGNLRMIKIREKRFFGLIKGAVCLDVFIKYPHEDNSYWEIANKKKFVPSKFYESFSKVDFKDYSYSIPKLTDDYLTYRYGDWQTPVKDWDTANDDKALA
ncbi:LicD family protein [Pontimicrobium sp. IMCC45349]|uniref:LicD family protein n=1 Tax=Pontimicrobium sp. IMCC45349 TaxID=3391574 RepID=UPI0039A29D71